MTQTLTISPLTRVEGHLQIQLDITKPDSQFQVIKARSSGTMFRGFEKILIGRDPRDASQYTQRVCGVCPVSHALAATLCLEDAFNYHAPANGRILRNLVLGANYLQSHVLHFYHLAAPDYIDTTGLLDMSPWKPRYTAPDMVTGATAATLVQHYVAALAIRRKAHQMGAIFGGKLPNPSSMVVGGDTENVTTGDIAAFKSLLDEIRAFIDSTYLPDVLAVAAAFPQYSTIGKGYGRLLSYGVFDLNNTGTHLLKSGRYDGKGNYHPLQSQYIREFVKYSYYQDVCGNRRPTDGLTEVSVDKPGAYSWIKAPRYNGEAHEVGPLARMWMTGDYRKGISVIDRVAARAYEAKKVADAMVGWLTQLTPGSSAYTYKAPPTRASGMGLTEAPRGALGHWIDIAGKKISRYQIVTPTAWNASPADDKGQAGPIEQALTGLRVADPANPIEVLRVVHSFDPCLSCSVHMVETERKGREYMIHL